jgi:hypothetical protein
MQRRSFLKSIAVASAAATGLRVASAADENDEEIEYLFVQNASAVSLREGVLTLADVAADTLYFSNRPERITGRVATEAFIADWGTGDDNFAEVPPNAVLSVFQEPEPIDVVVELSSPRISGSDLIYDVKVLDGNPEITGLANSLFIDVVGRPLTPGSVAGVARRSGRRTARRVDRRD